MAKNGIFIKAFDWLVENKGVNGQKGLAEALGISQNTISRIMPMFTMVCVNVIIVDG